MPSLEQVFERITFERIAKGLRQPSPYRHILRSGLDIFLAQSCPVCERKASATFCVDCQRQLQACQQKAHTTGLSWQGWPADVSLSPQPEQSVQQPLPIAALGAYRGTLKQAIWALKYGDRPDVAKPLGISLAKLWQARFPQPPLSKRLSLQSTARLPTRLRPASRLIRPLYALPIPLHASRQASRGYNQAELLARAFCQASGMPLLTEGFLRVQATQPQHQLGPAARQENLQQAFRVSASLRQRSQQQAFSVLLIDDIYTTGTTAISVAQTLQQAGIMTIGMLAVARAVMSSPHATHPKRRDHGNSVGRAADISQREIGI